MPMPRSFWIDGSATFTTVLSSMIMNSPTATATSVHHFRFSGVKSRARMTERLEQPLRPTWYGYPVRFARVRLHLEADRGRRREREPDQARAPLRCGALHGSPPHLYRRTRALLARCDRGPRARVLRALGTGRGHLSRQRVGHLVHGRQAESRLELRAQVGC